MNNEESIFAEAVTKDSAASRAAYLDEACAGDHFLRCQVEALLIAHDRPRGVLESPPVHCATTTEIPPPLQHVGSTIGPYKLLEQIGGGGMGVVYMAEQIRPIRRKVALKVIKPGMDSGQVIVRFEAERQALTMMDHPNIAKVLDAGTTDAGRPYFVMELVKGVPITDYCDQARLTTRQRLELFIQVCQAVQHAHQKGVIHRDLKPGNILVTLHDDKAVPKVIDFGIAKATGHQLTDRTLFTNYAQMLGTPLYMSPEQAQISGLDVDTRSDIYSLGVLLYELLTGTTPFDKQRLRNAAYDEMRRIIREEDPPKPSTRLSTLGEQIITISTHRHTDPKKLGQLVRGELDWIVMKAMEKDRTRRYESATGLAMDVSRYLNDEQVLACPQSTKYRLRKFARRNKHLLSTLVLLGLILLTAVGMAGVPATVVGTMVVAILTAGVVLLAEANRRAGHQRDKAEKNLAHAKDAEKRAHGAAAKAEAINRFLVEDLLAEAAPEKNAYGNRITVEELLNRAAGRIGKGFSEQPETEAAVRLTIGRAYDSLGRWDLAEPQLYRAFELRRTFNGAGHADTLEALNELTVVLEAQGKLAEAEPLFREALGGCRRALGQDHPLTLLAIHNLAWSLQNRDNGSEATSLYRECLVARRRILGPEHLDTLRSLHHLGWALWDQHEAAEAELLLREALTLRRKVLPSGHPEITKTSTLLGWVLAETGKTGEAELLLREALAVRRHALPADHWLTAVTANIFGGCLTVRGSYAEAEAVLLSIGETLAPVPDFLAGRIPSIAARLVALYEAWGRDEQAASWRARCNVAERVDGRPGRGPVRREVGGLRVEAPARHPNE